MSAKVPREKRELHAEVLAIEIPSLGKTKNNTYGTKIRI